MKGASLKCWLLTACAAVTALLAGVHVLAQGQEGLATARTLQDLDPQARPRWEVSLPAAPEAPYAVLHDRVVVASEDRKALLLFDLDGGPLGRVASTEPVSTLAASPGGEHLLVSASRSEDEHTSGVRDASGKELWSRKLGTLLSFSASGAFLYTEWNPTEHERPAAFDVETGRISWQAEDAPTHFELATAKNDTLAYYRLGDQGGLLSLIDLKTGHRLWQTDVPADLNHGLGTVHMSANGQTVATRTHVFTGGHRQAVTRVYGPGGELWWEKRVQPTPGKSNGGVIAAISDDGSLLALDDIYEFSIVRAVDGKELARIGEKNMCCVTVFTRDMLAIERDSETRLLFLQEDGMIAQYVSLATPLTFVPRGDTRAFGAQKSPHGYSAILATRKGGRLALSELQLDLRPSRRGPRE